VARGREEADALGLSELVALIDRRHPLLHRLEETPDTDPTMTLEGEFYTVHFQRRVLRFKATRGMHYIAQLLARPHADIHVLELTGSLEGADRSDAGEIVDATAVRAYRARLDVLRRQLDDAEELADVERAERARSEMERIARELTRSTQKGGKPRRASSAVDRARSAVRRRITDALERIEAEDAPLGALLRRAIRTGNHCAYRPFQ
jgi:hypothetical protein